MPLVIQSLAVATTASAPCRRRKHLVVPLLRGLPSNHDNAVTMLPNMKLCGGNAAVFGRRAGTWRGQEAVASAIPFRTTDTHGQKHVAQNLVSGSADCGLVTGNRWFSAFSKGSVCCATISGATFQGVRTDRGGNWSPPGKRFGSAGARDGRFGWNLEHRMRNQISHVWHRCGETFLIRESSLPKTICRAASYAASAVETTDSDVTIKKGALLEFETERGKHLLAVAQNRDGKKNWTAIDQSGCVHTVKPQQITYLVPSSEEFRASDIANFVGKVENLQDLALLECAWEEVCEEKVVHAESLAKILYSEDTTAVECYTVHKMLSTNQVYFRRKQHGVAPIYEPRPLSQVKELQQKRLEDAKAHELLLSYVKAIKIALECPQDCKPALSTWQEVEHFNTRTDALKAYALNSSESPAQKKVAEQVIEALGLSKNNPVVAVNLLIGMGVFPLHVNVDLLKLKNREFREEHAAAVEQLLHNPMPDPDMETRVNLTEMKVYTIDSSDTCEIDDGLSATRLPDGRIKVWIHIADPARWLPLDHILSRQAESRGTSIYLPTGPIPMFPMELATGQMSLQQGLNCYAITVSVILQEDGSIAEYSVMNSLICPTYKLSYDNVTELLLMHVAEEPELYLLAEAATQRAKWRISQGAMLTFLPVPDIKVTDPSSIEPSIIVEVKDQSTPSMQLVSEMMILCGEVIALIGEENGLCLPYRGQGERTLPKEALSNIPEGPGRPFAMLRLLGSAEMSFSKPIAHASLGLHGYVQFTSPIRRFADLLAHYQVKAHLRGDVLPLTHVSMESKMAMSNIRTKEARKLQASATRYWAIEYLRRQPKGRQYQAVVLQHLKDREVSVFILEVGIRNALSLSYSPAIGSEVSVFVVSADPRKDILTLNALKNDVYNPSSM